MPRTKRYKLLLDEMLPRRSKFPQLNNLHNLRHLVHDFKQSGIVDDLVVKLAKKENRIIVSKNIKHIRKICSVHKVDGIGLTETVQTEALDKKILALLKKRKKQKMTGEFIKLTSSRK